jgi:hypothetical protein
MSWIKKKNIQTPVAGDPLVKISNNHLYSINMPALNYVFRFLSKFFKIRSIWYRTPRPLAGPCFRHPLASASPVFNLQFPFLSCSTFPPFQTFLYSTSTSNTPSSRVQPPPFPNLPPFQTSPYSTSSTSNPPAYRDHPPPFLNLPVFNKLNLQSPSSVFNLPPFKTFLYSSSTYNSISYRCQPPFFPNLPVFNKPLQYPILPSSTSLLSKPSGIQQAQPPVPFLSVQTPPFQNLPVFKKHLQSPSFRV